MLRAMSHEMSIPATLQRSVIRGRVAVDIALVIAASAIIALAAQIAIPMPFSPVPMTLQPLAVLFLAAALGANRGAAAATLYLLEGVAGLPVFAQGHGGAIWLSGPTAGYLLSYPFAAFVAGWFSQRGWGNTMVRAVSGMLIALAVIYAGGWSWLTQFAGAKGAFLTGVSPFVVADIVKVAIGAMLLPYAQRLLSRVQ
jgi:biotin transport system substrate-specific component